MVANDPFPGADALHDGPLTGDPAGPAGGADDVPVTGLGWQDAAAQCSDQDARNAGGSPLRRLTRTEYARTLQQLLQLHAEPDVSAVPADGERNGFSVDSRLQTMSAQHLRAYFDVASGLADQLLADASRRRAVLGCEPADAGCLEAFTARFGRLAYRRALTGDELDGLLAGARVDAVDAEEPFRFVLEALLVSPKFLYRPEFGDGTANGTDGAPYPLTDHEIASRLSFSLLGRGPSRAVLDQVEATGLATPEARLQLAQTLATEGAFPEYYTGFFEQWLGYDELITPKAPPAGWDDALLADMRAETRAVLDRFAFGGERFLDVLRTDDTVLTPRLAAFYSIPTPGADGRAQVPAGHPRAGSGILGHAAILSKKSDGDAVALRGNWLRGAFLCQELHIPPNVADIIGERFVGFTHEEIIRARNEDGACKGCHAAIDPIGVGLDAFDATGRFDPTYVMPDYGITAGLPDAPEESFDGIAELATQLAALPEVPACITERAFLFTYGRQPTADDACTLQRAQQAFADANYDFRALVQALVTAPAFTLRRAPAADVATTAGAGETP